MVRSTYSLRTSSAVRGKDLLKAPSKAFTGAELVPAAPGAFEDLKALQTAF
jgi:hypothetical protein